jgi:hypothetical protein
VTPHDPDVTHQEFEMRLVAVESQTRHRGSRSVGTNADKAKPPKFDGSTPWTVFHCQFEVANHNNQTICKTATHLLAILQQAAEILHSVPAIVTYEDTVRAPNGCYGDKQLTVPYWSQLKAKIHLSSESLQEFAEAVNQLVHQALVRLPVDFIQSKAAHAFVNGVRDQELKLHLLMGGDRSPNKVLNQEAVKATAGPLARL